MRRDHGPRDDPKSPAWTGWDGHDPDDVPDDDEPGEAQPGEDEPDD